ncbi:MAG: Polysaccharide biosynthesis/export protein [Fibrobacteres bacterium]|nr:Polysaccharide biosynthesis/export protein [Fibrobacterota bacterium]
MRNPSDSRLASRTAALPRLGAGPLFALLLLLLSGAAAADDIPTSPHDETFVAGEAMYIQIPLDTAAFINGGYAVDSAGFVDLPVLGRLDVAGRTRDQVEGYLSGKLANYLKDTHIRAIPSIRLTLLGHWGRQGQYYVSPKTTVWEAIYGARGIGGDRNLDKIKVMRGDEEIDVPLLDEYARGRTLAAAGIRSGDIFLIPVPRDNTGGWYWFKEGLGATAQVATVVGTVLTAYITYTVLDRR